MDIAAQKRARAIVLGDEPRAVIEEPCRRSALGDLYEPAGRIVDRRGAIGGRAGQPVHGVVAVGLGRVVGGVAAAVIGHR